MDAGSGGLPAQHSEPLSSHDVHAMLPALAYKWAAMQVTAAALMHVTCAEREGTALRTGEAGHSWARAIVQEARGVHATRVAGTRVLKSR